ncbi:MAG: hypothetical protein JWM32_2063 [Verrucomicrobia bacterium]|nr:hypothetical protein [Verrucomicrobiota bacterium]
MDAKFAADSKRTVLLRRMDAVYPRTTEILALDAGLAPRRYCAEVGRGSVSVRLDPEVIKPLAIQWTQNGKPIPGAVLPELCLVNLSFDDSDLYYASISTAAGEIRSQAFVLVVMPANPLLNFSCRGFVTPDHPLIPGFVIGKAGALAHPGRYLFRALGPALASRGIESGLAHPRFKLFSRGSERADLLVATLSEEEVHRLAARAGAASIDKGASDAVGVAELAAGPYSLVVTGGPGEQGEVLVEIYELPR